MPTNYDENSAVRMKDLQRGLVTAAMGGVDTSTFVSLSDHATLEAKVDAINMDELAPLIKQAKITYDKAGVINWKQNGSSLSVTERESKFGSSIHFDGASSLYNANSFYLGGQDFTVDFWVFPVTGYSSDANYIIDFQRTAGTYKSGLLVTEARGGWYLCGLIPDTLVSPAGFNIWGNWQHIAIVYQHDTTTLKFFHNGVMTYSNTAFTFDRSQPILYCYFARAVHDNHLGFVGYLDEFRISDGIARWTADFTPPTSEYSLDSYTVSLLHW